jgi:hypothetical protein
MKASSFLVSFSLTLLCASHSLAGEFTEFGRVLFQGASTWVRADKVCQKDGMLFHKSKQEVSVNYCNGRDNSNCVLVKKPLGPQPIKSTTQRCVLSNGSDRDDCVKWATVPFVQGPTFKAKVYWSEQDYEQQRHPRATFDFVVPNCL